MNSIIDDLVARFERGTLSRRDLVQGLTALAAVGGSFDDVAKITLYFVDWQPDKLPALGLGVQRAAERLGVDLTKPVTLLGVAALGEPDLLVEVDVTAVLD